MRYIILASVFLFAACTPFGEDSEFIQDADRDRSIPFKVWVPDTDNHKGLLPLVLLSHGSGGEYANHGWLIDALLGGGFMVAAVNYPHNTTRDNTDEGVISVWQRPQDLSVLLDHLLSASASSDLIDDQRIGATGFSSGGYTVLGLAGAIYNSDLMQAYCSSADRGADCDLASDAAAVDYSSASASYKDPRVKAFFAMAPAVGPGITVASLQGIDQAVALIAAADDELVNPQLGAVRYAKHIPDAELVLLPSGGHFIFLECNAITQLVDWFTSELDLCGSEFNVDRAQLRGKVADHVVGFFAQHLSP